VVAASLLLMDLCVLPLLAADASMVMFRTIWRGPLGKMGEQGGGCCHCRSAPPWFLEKVPARFDLLTSDHEGAVALVIGWEQHCHICPDACGHFVVIKGG
jgi:hypothetical protein